MENHLSNAHDHVPVSQLWILRLLKIDRVRRKFVRKHDFRDDDLARFLDLHHWVDGEVDQFCPKKLDPPSYEDLEAISALANATPGDFANCRRQARFRNFGSATEFAQAVAEECRIKADRGAKRLGFGSV